MLARRSLVVGGVAWLLAVGGWWVTAAESEAETVQRPDDRELRLLIASLQSQVSDLQLQVVELSTEIHQLRRGGPPLRTPRSAPVPPTNAVPNIAPKAANWGERVFNGRPVYIVPLSAQAARSRRHSGLGQ